MPTKKQGRTWDPIQKQWVKYSLPEEAARVLKEEEDYQKEQAERRKQKEEETGGWVWVCRSILDCIHAYQNDWWW